MAKEKYISPNIFLELLVKLFVWAKRMVSKAVVFGLVMKIYIVSFVHPTNNVYHIANFYANIVSTFCATKVIKGQDEVEDEDKNGFS